MKKKGKGLGTSCGLDHERKAVWISFFAGFILFCTLVFFLTVAWIGVSNLFAWLLS